MQNKINFLLAYGVGYWIGQTHKGWKYFLFAVGLLIVESIILALFSRFFKRGIYKPNGEIRSL